MRVIGQPEPCAKPWWYLSASGRLLTRRPLRSEQESRAIINRRRRGRSVAFSTNKPWAFDEARSPTAADFEQRSQRSCPNGGRRSIRKCVAFGGSLEPRYFRCKNNQFCARACVRTGRAIRAACSPGNRIRCQQPSARSFKSLTIRGFIVDNINPELFSFLSSSRESRWFKDGTILQEKDNR